MQLLILVYWIKGSAQNFKINHKNNRPEESQRIQQPKFQYNNEDDDTSPNGKVYNNSSCQKSWCN